MPQRNNTTRLLNARSSLLRRNRRPSCTSIWQINGRVTTEMRPGRVKHLTKRKKRRCLRFPNRSTSVVAGSSPTSKEITLLQDENLKLQSNSWSELGMNLDATETCV